MSELDKSISLLLGRMELDRELTPVLEEMLTIEPDFDHHPASGNLFNWLVDPRHTGEEYSYVIGELADRVSSSIEENAIEGHFTDYVLDNDEATFDIYRSAAEALAFRCPVLEGSWELAAWTLVTSTETKHQGGAEYLSARFSDWIIHVIGDPDICPNPYLRFELITLLILMVDLDSCNRTQALKSVLSVCYVFNTDYMSVNISEFHQTQSEKSVLSGDSSLNIEHISANISKYSRIILNKITLLLARLFEDGNLLEYDETLAETLLKVKALRCSAIIHDVSYHRALSPTRFTEPREVNGIFSLLSGTSKIIQSCWIETHLEIYDKSPILEKTKQISGSLYVIISNLNASCQTPHLVCLTSMCIMDLVELVTKVNINLNLANDIDEYNNQQTLNRIDQILKYFCVQLDSLHLTRKHIRLDVIKKRIGRRNNTWKLLDCYNIFHNFFSSE